MTTQREREPQRIRRARRRVAHYADEARRAESPAGRMRVAERELLASIAHASLSARAARSVTGDAVDHARQLLDRPGCASLLALHEAKYARMDTDVARAGVALTWLRAGVSVAPDGQRDDLYEHYAAEFAREAARIRKER